MMLSSSVFSSGVVFISVDYPTEQQHTDFLSHIHAAEIERVVCFAPPCQLFECVKAYVGAITEQFALKRVRQAIVDTSMDGRPEIGDESTQIVRPKSDMV